MAIMSKPSAAPHISLTFITIGVVMAIPSAVWYAMFNPHDISRFFCVSLFFLGLAFLLIGLSVGFIGRTARLAELPPSEAIGAVVRQDQTVANRGKSPVGAPTAFAPAAYPTVGGSATTIAQTG